MKKCIRGRFGRVISMVLVTVMSLSGILTALAPAAFAAPSGRKRVFILPITTTAVNAPDTLGRDIVSDLQVLLQGQDNTLVYELQRTSPFLALAMEQGGIADEKAKAELRDRTLNAEYQRWFRQYPANDLRASEKALIMACYDVAIDPNAEMTRRRDAVNYLARVLSAHEVIFASVDNFEIVDDPRMAMINVTASRLVPNGSAAPTVTTMMGRGKSERRVANAPEASLTAEAVQDLARDVSAQLTGKAPIRTPGTVTAPPPSGGGGKGWLKWLLLPAAYAVATMLGGKDDMGQTQAGQAYAFSRSGGSVMLRLSLARSLAMKAEKYEIIRSSRGKVATRDTGDGLITVMPSQVSIQDPYVLITDRPMAEYRYEYKVRAYVRDGKLQTYDFTVLNGDAPTGPGTTPDTLVSPGVPPTVRNLQYTNPTGSQVKLTWGYDAFADTSLVTSVQVVQKSGSTWQPLGSALAGTATSATLNLTSDAVLGVVTAGAGSYRYVGDPPSVSVHIGASTLEPPTNVVIVPVKADGGRKVVFRVQWVEPSDEFVTSYKIYRIASDNRMRGPQASGMGSFRNPLMPNIGGGAGRGAVTLGRGRATTTELVAQVPRGTNAWEDTGVIDNRVYSYRAASLGTKVAGEFSSAASAERVCDVPPGNAGTFTAKAGDAEVKLQWSAPTKNADGSPISMMTRGGFNVYRMITPPTNASGYSLNELNPMALIKRVAWVNGQVVYDYTDTTVANRQTYYYAVVTEDDAGQLSVGPYPTASASPMPTPAQFTMDTASTTLTAGINPVNVSVKVADRDGVGLADYRVSLTLPVGQGTISVGTVYTDAQGMAVFQYRPPTTVAGPTAARISGAVLNPANLGGAPLLTTKLDLTIVPPVPSVVQVSLSPRQTIGAVTPAQKTAPPSESTTDVVVAVTDKHGVVVGNVPVTITSTDAGAGYLKNSAYVDFSTGAFTASTDASGAAKMRLRAGTTVGTMTLTVKAGSLAEQLINVDVTAGRPASLTLSLPSAISARATGTVSVRDGNGTPVPEAQINITTTAGKVTPTTAYTNAQGEATFTLDPNNQANVIATVTASTTNGIAKSATVQLLAMDNPVLVSGDADVAMNSATAYTWRLLDADGKGLVSRPVTVKTSAGSLNAVGTKALSLTTDLEGRVSFTFLAPSDVGTATLTFYDTAKIGTDEIITIKLPAPSGLTATAASEKKINLTWSTVLGASGYRVQRSADQITWVDAASPLADGLTFPVADTGVLAGTKYYYRVQTTSSTLSSQYYSKWSTIAEATTKLAPPDGVRFPRVTDSEVDVAWNAVTGAVKYEVLFDTTGAGPYTNLAFTPRNQTQATVVLPASATWYYIQVVAYDENNVTSTSDAMRVFTAPQAPGGPTLTTVPFTQVDVTWTASPRATSYVVERSTDGISWTLVATAPDVATISDSGLAVATKYSYRVAARAAGMQSAWTLAKSATTYPGQPTGLSAAGKDQANVVVTWNAAAGAESYLLQTRPDTTAAWTDAGETGKDVRSFTISGLTAGQVFYCRAVARDVDGKARESLPIRISTALAVPTNAKATVVSATQVDVSWDPMAGFSFDIERSLDGIAWTPLASVSGVNSYADMTVVAGNTYYYHVRAARMGDYSSWTMPVKAVARPMAPTGLHAQRVTDTNVELAWNAVAGVTGYRVQMSIDGTTWTGGGWLVADGTTTYVVTGLTANVQRWFRVASVNDGGETDSTAIAVTTAPAAPPTLTLAAKPNGQVTVTWTTVTGATDYLVERSLNGSVWATALTAPDPQVSFTDGGLAAGTKYYYRVRAANWVASSAWSVTQDVTTFPAAPTGLAVTQVTSGVVKLSWTAVTGVTGYRVQTRPYDVATWTDKGDVPVGTTEFTLTGLVTAQYARVLAVNDSGTTESTAVRITNALPAPALPTLTLTPPARLTLGWVAVPDAVGYDIQRSLDGIAWSNHASVGAVASFDDDGLQSGVKYFYRLRAKTWAEESPWTSSVSRITPPGKPLNLTVTAATDSEVTLSWSAVTGAESYVIQGSANGAPASWTEDGRMPAAGGTTITISGLAPSLLRYFRVYAENDNGANKSEESTAVSARTLPLAPVAPVATANADGEVAITWAPVATAIEYRLRRSADRTAWTILGPMPSTAADYIDMGLPNGGTYYYQLSVRGQAGWSAWSGTVSVKTVPSAPSNLATTQLAPGVVRLTWDPGQGAESYRIESSANGVAASFTLVEQRPEGQRSYDVSIPAGTTMFYRVVAVAGTLSKESAPIRLFGDLTAPANLLFGTVTTSEAPLSWTAVTGALNYEVQRSLDGAAWTTIALGEPSTSFLDSGLTSGQTYYYRVRARNTDGSSAFTAAKSVATVADAPANLRVTGVTETEVSLAWDAVAGAASYAVLSSASGLAPFTQVGEVPAGITAHTIGGFAPATRAWFIVRAVNGSGPSKDSSVVLAITNPLTPPNLTVTLNSPTEVLVTWSAVAGATRYELQRSIDGVNWDAAVTIAGALTSYTDATLTGGSVYYYRIRAVSEGGVSSYTAAKKVETRPTAPTGLTASLVGTGLVRFQWQASNGATLYTIKTAADPIAGPWTNIDSVAGDTTSLTATVALGAVQYFCVEARNAAGAETGTPIRVVSGATVPAGLAVVPPTTTTRINLQWNAQPGTFDVERSLDGQNWTAVASAQSANTLADMTVTAGTEYYYRVRANTALGMSMWSTPITATTPPAIPTGISAVRIDATEIDFTWNAAVGATEYRLETSPTGAASTYTAFGYTPADRTTFMATGLTAGGSNYYRVVAVNTAAGLETAGTGIRVVTLPAAPPAPTATVTAKSVTFTWAAVPNATSYVIERSTNGTSWTALPAVTGLTFTDANLATATTYYYRMKALVGSLSSNYSDTLTVTTIPQTPLFVRVLTTTNSTAEITWQAAAGAERYQIEVDNAGTWETHGTVAAAVTQFTLVALAPNTAYSVRVVAVNEAGSAPSAAVTARTMAIAPLSLTVTPVAATQLDLAWTAIANVDSYEIERSLDGTVWNPLTAITGGANTYQDKSCQPGTFYFYRVRATSTAGASGWSSPMQGLTAPVVTAGLTTSDITDRTITLVWPSVKGAEQYLIEYFDTPNNAWAYVATVPNTQLTYLVTGLVRDTAYRYRLTASNTSGSSVGPILVTRTGSAAAPDISLRPLSASSILVRCGSITDVVSYDIQRSLDRATWTDVATIIFPQMEYTDSGLQSGTTYYYRVRAKTYQYTSSWSQLREGATFLGAPTATVLNVTDTTADVSWMAVTGATRYTVEYITENNFSTQLWMEIGSAPAGVHAVTVTSLPANTSLYVRVSATDNATPVASNAVPVRTAPSAPVMATPDVKSSARVTLTWADVTDETGYEVQRSTDQVAWTTIALPLAGVTTVDDTGLTGATTYYYRVRSKAGALASTWSLMQTATTVPMAPTGLTAVAGSTAQVVLTWNAVAGAVEYHIERQDALGVWSAVDRCAEPTYTVLNVLGSTAVTYRVAASNATGLSTWSTPATVYTPTDAPGGVSATALSSTMIVIRWDTVDDESSYLIQRSPDGGVDNWTTVGTAAQNITLFGDGTVQANTRYYYRVAAVRGGVNSPWSAMVTTTTPPQTSPLITATVDSSTAVSLTWNAVADVTGYSMEWRPSGTLAWQSRLISTVPGKTQYVEQIDTLSAGTQFDFRVGSRNAGSADATYSSVISATTPPDKPVLQAATTLSVSSIRLDWVDVTGETSYEVQRNDDPALAEASWTTIAPALALGTTQYTAAGLTSGRSYAFRVRAVNVSGPSEWSAVLTGYTMPQTPALAITEINGLSDTVAQATLTWPAVAGAAKYEYQRKLAADPDWPADGTVVNGVAGMNTALDSTIALLPGTIQVYQYRVRALLDPSGTASEWSTPVQALTCPVGATTLTLTVPAASVSTSALTAQWNDLDYETKYELQRSPDGLTYTTVASPVANATSHTLTGLPSGTEGWLRIRGVLLQPGYPPAYTAYSAPVSVTTGPEKPANVTAEPAGAGSTKVTWDPVAGAATYAAQYRLSSIAAWQDVPAPTFTVDGGKVAMLHSGLTAGIRYYYQVRAVSAAGVVSDWSAEVSTTTITVQAIQAYGMTVTAGRERIYYSTLAEDMLSATAPTSTDLVISGYADLNRTIPAANAQVKLTITNGKGHFQPKRADQVLDANGQTITGMLDANGRMTIIYRGRITDPMPGIAGLYPPVPDEIGRPAFEVVDMTSAPTVSTPITVDPGAQAPVLVGPPSSIDVTPNTESVTMNEAITTVTASVYDAANQPVLAGMPIWFAQSWTPWTNPADPGTATIYQVKGSASIIYGDGGTDAAGTITAQVSSRHSGRYRIHAFAVKRDAPLATLKGIGNLTTTVVPYADALLMTGIGVGSVTDSTTIVNKTLVYGNHWTVAADTPRVNVDGTQLAKLTIIGTDEDGKRVLSDVPFRVMTDLGRLWLTPGGPAVSAGQWLGASTALRFDDNGQANVFIGADPSVLQIGTASLTMDNTRIVGQYATVPNVVAFYGPSLTPAGGFDPLSIRLLPPSGRIASTDEPGAGATRTATITIRLADAAGNNFPSGYTVTLMDGGVVRETKAIVGSPSEVTFDFSSNVTGPHAMTVRVDGQTATGPAMRISDPFDITVAMAAAATVGEPAVDVLPLNTVQTFTADVVDEVGNTVVDGTQVKFRVVTEPGFAPSDATLVGAITVTAGGVTDLVTMNTGTVVTAVRVVAYSDRNGDDAIQLGEKLGETNLIYLGLDAPTGLSVMPGTITATGMAVQWNAVLNATAYNVEVMPAGGAWTMLPSVPAPATMTALAGLLPGTTYSVRVSASFSAPGGTPVDSAVSATATATTLPSAPAALVAVPTSTSVALTWPVVAEVVTGYRVLRNGVQIADIADPLATAYTDLLVSSGTAYTYTVRAYNVTGESADSLVAAVTTKPLAPALLPAVPQAHAATLHWTPSSGLVDGYKVYRDGVLIQTVPGGGMATYTDTGLDLGPAGLASATTYAYGVRAVNGSGDSDDESTMNVLTLPDAPLGLTATPATTTVDLTWQAVAGNVTGYRVYRAGVLRGQVPAGTLTYTDTTTSATAYSYTVRAINASGESADSATVNTLTRALPPAITSLTATAYTATITWTPSSGTVTGFRVYRNGGLIADIANPLANSYTDLGLDVSPAGLLPATTYTYGLRAYNAAGMSATFTAATVTTELEAPTGLAIQFGVPGSGRGTVAWNVVTTGVVDGYNVYRNGVLVRSATLAELLPDPADPINRVMIEDTGLLSETVYTYTVRAFNAATGESVDSVAVVGKTPNWGYIVTPPPAPANLQSDALALTASTVKLTWDIPLGLVDGYRVYRNGLEIANVTDGLIDTYTDTGRTGGTTYTYTVRAYNAGGNSIDSVALPVLTKPGAPVNVQAVTLTGPTRVVISWNVVPNTVAGYRVLRDGVEINGGDPSNTNQGVTTYTDLAVVEGTEYTYQVIAYNASGDGEAVEAP